MSAIAHQGTTGVQAVQAAAEAAIGKSVSAMDIQMDQLEKAKTDFARSIAEEQVIPFGSASLVQYLTSML